MSKPKIYFEHEGQKYEVDLESYNKDLLIQLPDGTVIKVLSWLESYPPQVGDYKVMQVAKAKAV